MLYRAAKYKYDDHIKRQKPDSRQGKFKMLTKEQVIEELRKHEVLGKGRVMFKVLDYTNNGLAPEKVAYRLYYVDYLGQRRKVTYYPNSVGFQWSY